MATENEIPHGKKTFKVEIHFWTNDLPKPVASEKLAWGSGTVHIHKGRTGNAQPAMRFFKSMDDLVPTIKELLAEQDVQLVAWKKVAGSKTNRKERIIL